MFQTVPIKCPRCNQYVHMLEFWKQYKDRYYHICKSCMGTTLSEEDLLNIGFHYGREDFKRELRLLIG